MKRSNQHCSFYIIASEVKEIIVIYYKCINSIDMGGYKFPELIIKTEYLLETIRRK